MFNLLQITYILSDDFEYQNNTCNIFDLTFLRSMQNRRGSVSP